MGMKKLIIIITSIGCSLNFYSCTEPSHQAIPAQTIIENVKKPVKIPEGTYVCTDNHSGDEHKTKFGKFLGKVAEISKEQMVLNHQIFVQGEKIISNAINGSREMPIETGNDDSDSLFFINMPILNNTQMVEVRLQPGNRLNFFVMNQELHYKLENK